MNRALGVIFVVEVLLLVPFPLAVYFSLSLKLVNIECLICCV